MRVGPAVLTSGPTALIPVFPGPISEYHTQRALLEAGGDAEQFIIRNHFETESGIGIQGILPTGDVTIVKCGGECLDEYYLGTGTLTENTNYINMCRTQVRIKMNAPAEYFLRNPLGNHHIMLHGNYELMLDEFLQSNGCKRIE